MQKNEALFSDDKFDSRAAAVAFMKENGQLEKLKQLSNADKAMFSDDAFMMPVVEGDPLLHGLDLDSGDSDQEEAAVPVEAEQAETAEARSQLMQAAVERFVEETGVRPESLR
eukprot:TRINITY_DN5639_c0_g1_i1.p3 TRINITY_DN5639_c0_g1~~TRINITY_DN5639_c0_g1_i1.p3  ORF type:complete len:113 (+),score=46.69 TRINITY_DN5639_c0_g1_i1:424-762(+)